MKCKAKTEITEHRKHLKGTGGGPARQMSEVASTFSAILPPIATEGIQNPIDDDASDDEANGDENVNSRASTSSPPPPPPPPPPVSYTHLTLPTILLV